MIVFDLRCTPADHRFEGWFASSESYDDQRARGLIGCPHCGSTDIDKAIMAPAVGRKGNQAPAPAPAAAHAPVAGGALSPEAREVLGKLAQIQVEALKGSRWVGADFADVSRAMHYGERDAEVIHGQASADQAKDLIEEGIAVMPLLVPVIPPDELN